jgi:hypothetical protein
MRKGLVFVMCACFSFGVFFLIEQGHAQTPLQTATPPATLQQQVKPLVIPGATKLGQPTLPDLVPVSCSFNPSTYTPGEGNVFLSVKYKNAGAADAVIMQQACDWSAVCAQNPNAAITSINTSPTSALQPGVERFSTATSPYLPQLRQGTYTFAVKLDPNNQVAESNEYNNEMSCTLTVVLPDVDLRITNVALSKASVSSSDAFFVYVSVINGAKTTPLKIPAGTLMVSAAPFAENAYQNSAYTMQPGQTLTYMLRATTTGRQKGTQTWTFTVDPNNAFVERMETNNQATLQVTVN